jgi:hypothetical protein
MLCQAHDEAEDIRRAISIGEVPRFYKLPHGSFVTHPHCRSAKRQQNASNGMACSYWILTV